jgi:plastocyanin
MMRSAIATLVVACALPCGLARAQAGAVKGTLSAPGAGITGVVVYLVPVDGTPPRPPATSAVMDQRGMKFVPRVLAVTPGSTVAFMNSDPVMHNVFHPSGRTRGFDLGTFPEGETRSSTFAQEGAYVIFCRVHPEMIGYVVVVASSNLAVTDDDGKFDFEGVAPGTYHLRTWHNRLRSLDEVVTVAAGGTVALRVALKYGAPTEPTAASGAPPR